MVEQIEHKTGMIRRNIQSTYVNVNECNEYHYRDAVDLSDAGSPAAKPLRSRSQGAEEEEEEGQEDDVFLAKEKAARKKQLAV